MVEQNLFRPAGVFTAKTPRVVAASKLHRARARKKTGTFLAEGINSVEAAVRSGAVRQIFATELAWQQYRAQLEVAASGTGDAVTEGSHGALELNLIDESAVSALADTVTSTGLFAVCDTAVVLNDVASVLANSSPARPVVVAVDCQDPGNAGTLIRLTDALGAAGVVFTGDSVDPVGAKVVRSSAGSIFGVPVARDPDFRAVFSQLAGAEITALLTTLDGSVSLSYQELPAKPVAWVFGNEAHGLTEEVLQAVEEQQLDAVRVSIPIVGTAESLNLATAAAICLWETARGKSGSCSNV